MPIVDGATVLDEALDVIAHYYEQAMDRVSGRSTEHRQNRHSRVLARNEVPRPVLTQSLNDTERLVSRPAS